MISRIPTFSVLSRPARLSTLTALSALALMPVASPSYAAGHKKVPETPVRATLGDGQVLMGAISTKTLQLKSGSGDLDVPLADVGEVVPSTGGKLGEADGRVDVWLKNGSELRGTWAEPKLAMSIRVGGNDVPVDLPMNDLSRFQLQGAARWPGGPIYRMRTRFGDDFLVDPSKTHLVIVNDLGTFQPLLSECQSVAPVGDPEGPWRVQLQTGTVLLGKLADDKVTVALPMGPSEVSVPLAQFVSLKVESWQPVAPPIALAAPVYSGERDGMGGSRKDADDAAGLQIGPDAQLGTNVEMDEPAYAEAAPADVKASMESGRASSRTPARAKPSAPAPAAAAPAPADAWFDNTAIAKTKSQGN